jgi:hypothetical protein
VINVELLWWTAGDTSSSTIYAGQLDMLNRQCSVVMKWYDACVEKSLGGKGLIAIVQLQTQQTIAAVFSSKAVQSEPS